MQTSLETTLTPAEFAGLASRDLSKFTCVVFDILRATTSMVAALANGARGIVPVAEIEDALRWRQRDPQVLLAGERDGLRICARQTGGVDFDLGNSPREFTSDRVRGKLIVTTTTNGTRALRACAHASRVLVSSFLNLEATVDWLKQEKVSHLILVCSGTHEEPALEDVAAAGALCERVWTTYDMGHISDGALIARRLIQSFNGDLMAAMEQARNGRRLLSLPELHDDVAYAIQRDIVDFVAILSSDGVVQRC